VHPSLRLPLVASLLALSGSGAAAQILKDSPFLPPAGATTAAPVQETLQLSGVIASGKSILVNITETKTKLSLWIPVGQTTDGVEVLSYDDATDTVAIRVKSEVKKLKLRSATIVDGPNTVAAPASPSIAGTVEPAPLLTQAEQEREARMLVSDLLEIGLQQRKAYEEAQRKAAASKAKK
jgi:hypothetical protein